MLRKDPEETKCEVELSTLSQIEKIPAFYTNVKLLEYFQIFLTKENADRIRNTPKIAKGVTTYKTKLTGRDKRSVRIYMADFYKMVQNSYS